MLSNTFILCLALIYKMVYSALCQIKPCSPTSEEQINVNLAFASQKQF